MVIHQMLSKGGTKSVKMKVVCINGRAGLGYHPIHPDAKVMPLGYEHNPNSLSIEVGKVYEVVHESRWFYYIDNGIGGQNSYPKEDFKPLRESNLDVLLSEK
jgi:hypothetical protein